MTDPQTPATEAGRFDGPDCGVNGCGREVGHTGEHRRDPAQTPATEAGRRLLALMPRPDIHGNSIAWQQRIEDIEAEARADYAREAGPGHAFLLETAVEAAYDKGRADALREAADAVRAAPRAFVAANGLASAWYVSEMHVLAILDPEAS